MTQQSRQSNSIGIIGGGQLGRMLSLAAARLGIETHIFCPEGNSPAQQVTPHHTVAPYTDVEALKTFCDQVDVVTFEFENIPVATLEALDKPVFPTRRALEVTQDRLSEKTFLQDLNIPVAPFHNVESYGALQASAAKTQNGILKTRRFGYDGKGQVRLDPTSDLAQVWSTLQDVPCVLEALINFESEFSVIAVRDQFGKIMCYDPARNVHKNHILHTSTVPAGLPNAMLNTAIEHTHAILEKLDYVGVMGVEFFALRNGQCLVNEMAPRVHNSGHWTMNGCVVDQFENHIRAVCGWPVGDVARHSDVEMCNLIGNDISDLDKSDGQAFHLYGKKDAREGRKMGHVNRLISTAC